MPSVLSLNELGYVYILVGLSVIYTIWQDFICKEFVLQISFASCCNSIIYSVLLCTSNVRHFARNNAELPIHRALLSSIYFAIH